MKNEDNKKKKNSYEEPLWKQKEDEKIRKFQEEDNKSGNFNERVRKAYEDGVDMGGSYSGTDEFGNM